MTSLRHPPKAGSIAGYRLQISNTKCNTVSINSFLAGVLSRQRDLLPSTKSDLKTLLNGTSASLLITCPTQSVDSDSCHNISFIEKLIQFRITSRYLLRTKDNSQYLSLKYTNYVLIRHGHVP